MSWKKEKKENPSAICYLRFPEGSIDFKQHFSISSNGVEVFFIQIQFQDDYNHKNLKPKGWKVQKGKSNH